MDQGPWWGGWEAWMNLLQMRGAYGGIEAWLYATVVAGGIAPLYQRFVDEAVPPVEPGGPIIDVGCGDGQVARRLAQRFVDHQVVGLDLSPDMIARARKGNTGLSNLELRVGDAMNLPLESSSVALAVTVASIKHWPDQARGLSELLRVLEPGGALCLLEADPECSKAAARAFVSTWRYVVPGTAALVARYFRQFVAGQSPRAADLERLCRAAGFVDLEVERQTDMPVSVVRGRRPLAAA
jgi:ubiquinone/menaquinone biosynthesis C-methylase UbiE